MGKLVTSALIISSTPWSLPLSLLSVNGSELITSKTLRQASFIRCFSGVSMWYEGVASVVPEGCTCRQTRRQARAHARSRARARAHNTARLVHHNAKRWHDRHRQHQRPRWMGVVTNVHSPICGTENSSAARRREAMSSCDDAIPCAASTFHVRAADRLPEMGTTEHAMRTARNRRASEGKKCI